MSYGIETYRHTNPEGQFEYHLNDVKDTWVCQWISSDYQQHVLDENSKIIYTVACLSP